jgi:hypothetical protein
MLSASPIVEQLIANPMSRLRGEFRILGLSSLAFSDAPTALIAPILIYPGKAWAIFSRLFGPYPEALGFLKALLRR